MATKKGFSMNNILSRLLDLYRRFQELTAGTNGVVVVPTHDLIKISSDASDFVSTAWFDALKLKDTEVLTQIKPLAKDFTTLVGKADLNMAWAMIATLLHENGIETAPKKEPLTVSAFQPHLTSPSSSELSATNKLVFHNGMLKQLYLDSLGDAHWLPVEHVADLPL